MLDPVATIVLLVLAIALLIVMIWDGIASFKRWKARGYKPYDYPFGGMF